MTTRSMGAEALANAVVIPHTAGVDVEQTRLFLRSLPHVAETMQWGANLVYWAGDKAIGGRMFALINLDDAPRTASGLPRPPRVLSFHAGVARYADLLETEGMVPAPYLARAGWVALERWDVVSTAALRALLASAHAQVFERLPRRTRDMLALPEKQADQRIREQRALQKNAADKKPLRKKPDDEIRSV